MEGFRSLYFSSGEAITAMNNRCLYTLFILAFVLQIICEAKADFGRYNSGNINTPFIDQYAKLYKYGSLNSSPTKSIFDDDSSSESPSNFDTDSFFTKKPSTFVTDPFGFSSSPSTAGKSTRLDYDKTSDPFKAFDALFGSFPSTPSLGGSSFTDNDSDDYNYRKKTSNKNSYSTASTSHHVYITFPKASDSSYDSPSYPTQKPVADSKDSSFYKPNSGYDDNGDIDRKNTQNSDYGDDKEPSPLLGNPGALAGAAAAGAAGAALGSALTKKPQPSPPQAAAAPSPAVAAPNPPQHMPMQHEDKCNWCLRANCNPGGCRDVPNFSATRDAEVLNKALKNKDEKTAIGILTHRSDKQIKKIRQEYLMFATSLEADITSTSFKTKDLLLALLLPRATYFAEELHKACEKADSEAMIMILTSLSPCAIKKVGLAFSNKYGKMTSLAKNIKDATNNNFEDFIVELSKGVRQPDGTVDQNKVNKDVKALMDAGPNKWFVSDKSVYIDIFTHRSYSHLREVIKAYDDQRKSKKSNLYKDIDDNTSAKLEKGLLSMLKNVADQPGYFADELEGSLDKLVGSGVADPDTLIRIMRGRCGIDLGDIRDAYPKNHNGKKLGEKLAKKEFEYNEVLQSMLQEPGSQAKRPNQ